MSTFIGDNDFSDPVFPFSFHERNGSFADALNIDLDLFSAGNRTDLNDPNAPTASMLGKVNHNNDVDVYKFVVTQQDDSLSFFFDIDGTTNGLDTQIQLFDAAGTFIQDSDDSAGIDSGSTTIRDSSMSFTPTAPGTYYIAVTSWNNDWRGTGAGTGGSSSGDYTLHISASGSIGIQSFGSGTFASDQLFGDRMGDPIADNIHGYAGNDEIFAGENNDTVYGGDGADTLYGDNGNDFIYGDDNIFNDIDLPGGFGEGPGDEDRIYGGEGDDYLQGGRGKDTILGGGGADRLLGGDGNDRIDGGPGADQYERESQYATGSDTFVLRKLESTVTAPDFFDYFNTYTSFDGAGVAGGDKIEFAGFGQPVFFRGEVGFNIVIGSPLPGGGNGVIDAIYADDGSKTTLILDNDDNGAVSANDLMVQWGIVVDLIAGDFKAGQTIGPTQGLASNETFTGDAGSDFFLAGGGNDTVRGGGGIDLINGEAGADRLFGQDGNDSLDGDTQNDQISGGTGRDVLFGGDGADMLIGGADRDRLTGGAGKDVFDFNLVAESGTTNAARDIILDFNPGSATTAVDRIDVHDIDAQSGAGNQDFAFIGNDPFDVGTKGQLRVVHRDGNTIVAGEVNGDGVADFEIAMGGTIPFSKISAGDFIL